MSGSGRPVIFIPDLSAPARIWDSTLAHVGGGVEAHVLDVAGFAGNPAVERPLLSALRDDLAQYLRERSIKDAILVGHMFGGTVAYLVAMTESELIGGLLVIDVPPSSGDGDQEQVAELARERQALEDASPEKFRQMMIRRLRSMMRDADSNAYVATEAARSSQPVIAETFYDMLTRDLRPLIRKVSAPVVTILTTGNIPSPHRSMVESYYRAQLDQLGTKDHKLVIVEDSKHYVMFDKPDLFFTELDRFLAATK